MDGSRVKSLDCFCKSELIETRFGLAIAQRHMSTIYHHDLQLV